MCWGGKPEGSCPVWDRQESHEALVAAGNNSDLAAGDGGCLFGKA